jgi:hypothetical protein
MLPAVIRVSLFLNTMSRPILSFNSEHCPEMPTITITAVLFRRITPHYTCCEEVPAGLPVQVVDITDIANPSSLQLSLRMMDDTPHNPYVIGDYLVLAAYSDGAWVYDVSDPHNPVMSGYFDSHPQNGTYVQCAV